MGGVSPAEAERWWTYLREAHEVGTFLYGVTALIVDGVKGQGGGNSDPELAGL